MKINVRLLLINFIIVLVVTLTSTVVYYSVTNSFFKAQNSKILLNSANDFIFTVQSEVSKIDESFNSFINSKEKRSRISSSVITKIHFDFIFQIKQDSLIDRNSFLVFNNQKLNSKARTINGFIRENPNIILRYAKLENSKIYYYGKMITFDFLQNLEKTIGAKISFTIDNLPFALPGDKKKNRFLYQIIKAVNNLKYKNNFDLFTERMANADFFSTYYSPKPSFAIRTRQGFLIYTTPKEGVEYASTMKMMVVIIIFAGLSLSVVFILLFTGKLRKQIFILSETAKEASKGNLEKRIPILTKDEIGQFAESFNGMLDELARKSNEGKEYTEFLALLNQNPELKEVSETALSKILQTGNFSVGTLYLVHNKELRCLTYFGVEKTFTNTVKGNDLYKEVIKKKKFIEFSFKEDFPIIKSGLTEIKLKYLLIFPILFNKEVIAIIELASQTVPTSNIKGYLERIQNQLAIGLVNAKSLEQLENLVSELRELNDNYQKKNDQIKNQNEELLKLHDELKHQTEELEKQKNKAETLAKVKSQFLASMSHELRTPLNSILGLTELAFHDKSTTSKTKERLNIVIRNGNKLLSLINNILEFSKVESGKIELIEKEFLLSDFLNELQSFISPLVVEKGLEFFIEEIPDKDLLIKTDKNKLDQILTNLLGNSVKFTNEGSIKLTVVESDKDALEFKVSDTGIGITEKEKERVFEEFLQVESGSNRKFGGTGLGLAICKRYIELLNGELKLKSIIGKGSEFTVILPNIIKERLKTINRKTKKHVPIENKHNPNSIAVLIINSKIEIQKIFEDYLSNYEVKCTFANNADDGFQMAMELNPNFIILDVFLDDNKGLDLLIKLKSNDKTFPISTIVTAFNSADKLGYGFMISNYFTNTISENKLDDVISNLQSGTNSIISDIIVIANTQNTLPINSKYSVKEYKPNNFNLLITVFKEKTPDLVIFNIGESYQQELSILFELQSDKYLQKIPVLVCLPNQINEELRESIISDVNSIIRKGNFHRYDVLKIIRNRLNLFGMSQSEKKLLIDELDFENKIKNTDKSGPIKPQNIKVLIVDDDPDTLFTVGEIVSDLGFDTEYAHNGVECLLSINSNTPHIILLDIMMPQMDGFETIKRIRSSESTKHLPVIALTAHAMLEDKEIIEKNGFDGLITKPINRAELAFKVKRILKIDAPRAL